MGANEVTIQELLKENAHFYIPDYQRGYRWQKRHIHDFLDDILELDELRKKEPNAWNCIQPIVLLNCSITTDTEEHIPTAWEVIDGQQRLTSIKLILEALGEKVSYKLWYPPMDSCVSHGSRMDEDFKGRVAGAVKTWLETKPEGTDRIILCNLKKNTGFIRLILNNTQPATESFTRLNINRIPLQAADLIKAMLLRRHEYDDAPAEETAGAQAEIAAQWNEIEDAISDDRFWLMFNRSVGSRNSRMQQLFRLAYQAIYKKDGNHSANAIFRFFMDIIKNGSAEYALKKNKLQTARRVWEQLLSIYYTVREWYDDVDLYHYIGLLCTISEVQLVTILNAWNADKTESTTSCTAKASFKQNLLKLIRNTKGFSYKGENQEELPPLDNLRYGQHDTAIRNALLLHNIGTIMRQNKLPQRIRSAQTDSRLKDKLLQNMGNRFPFHMYRKCRWHLEHVFSRAQENNDTKPRDEMVQCIQHAILKHPSPELERLTKDYNTETDIATKADIYNKIINSPEIKTLTSLIPDEKRDSIANLVLLDSTTNESYGNASFYEKRERILNSWLGKVPMKEYAYILPCTLSAFAKAYTPGATHIRCWDNADAAYYLNDMNESIKYFFES